MAVKLELIVVILPDGTIEMKTEGFKGQECEAELKPFEQSLGKVIKRTRTKEYYEQAIAQKNKISRSTK